MADVITAVKSIPLDKIFIGAAGLFIMFAFAEPYVRGVIQNSFLRGVLYVAIGGVVGYAVDGPIFKVVGTSIALFGGYLLLTEVLKSVGVLTAPAV